MKDYRAYLLDLDGTMYRGTDHVEGASEFVQNLLEQGVPYMFLTNNSSKKPEQVVEKLRKMAIPARLDQIFTTSMATARYIRMKSPRAKVYVIGEEGLFDALEQEGLQIVEKDADYVIVGIDRDINYQKLANACLQVRKGASLISTNGDVAIPTEKGMLPGNGALTSVISVSTGCNPVYIGKPETIIMEQALRKLGHRKEDVLMVGDNYHTDILAGLNSDIDTLMVETGVSEFKDVCDLERQPTHKISNLLEWM